MFLDLLGRIQLKYVPLIVTILIGLIYKFHPRHEIVLHTKCPHSWIKYQDKCYKLIKRVSTYQEAVKLCHEARATLPIVNDAKTNEFLVNFPLPSPLYLSKGTIDKFHSSHDDHAHDPNKYRSVYDHAHHVKAIWLSVEPIYLANFTGNFYWSENLKVSEKSEISERSEKSETLERLKVSWRNFTRSDPAKDLYDIGIPYVAGLTINGDMMTHLDLMDKGLIKSLTKEEELISREAISDHLKEAGKWELYIDLNVCGHCLAAICQKSVSKADGSESV